MKNILRPALVLFALLSVLTGLLYPLVVTGAAQAPKASGSSAPSTFPARTWWSSRVDSISVMVLASARRWPARTPSIRD